MSDKMGEAIGKINEIKGLTDEIINQNFDELFNRIQNIKGATSALKIIKESLENKLKNLKSSTTDIDKILNSLKGVNSQALKNKINEMKKLLGSLSNEEVKNIQDRIKELEELTKDDGSSGSAPSSGTSQRTRLPPGGEIEMTEMQPRQRGGYQYSKTRKSKSRRRSKTRKSKSKSKSKSRK
jgi:vacuolar-type H+-ATPase subunit I/STV1